MTENQKLREAFEAYITDNGKWPNAILKAPGGQYLLLRTSVAWQDWKACAEALAMPTAEVMTNGLTQAETDASASVSGLTAAPVGERYSVKHEITQGGYRLFTVTDSESQCSEDVFPDDNPVLYGLLTELGARAALSAGDAGWQPIDTAQKDGSDCWLLVEGEVRRGFWVEIEFEERRDLDGRYIDQTDDDAYWMDKDSGDSLEPTMFYPITKPLPPAPAMRKGQL